MNAKKHLSIDTNLNPAAESDSSASSVTEIGDTLFQNKIEPSNRQGDQRERKTAAIFTQDLQYLNWMTSAQAAVYMGVTAAAIRNRVYRGDLKPRKPFGKRGKSYFSRRELDHMMGGLR